MKGKGNSGGQIGHLYYIYTKAYGNLLTWSHLLFKSVSKFSICAHFQYTEVSLCKLIRY